MWKLDINYDKTKSLIFGTRNNDRFSFKMGESKISICKEFKYLGVVFTHSRSLYKASKHSYDQVKRLCNFYIKELET